MLNYYSDRAKTFCQIKKELGEFEGKQLDKEEQKEKEKKENLRAKEEEKKGEEKERME